MPLLSITDLVVGDLVLVRARVVRESIGFGIPKRWRKWTTEIRFSSITRIIASPRPDTSHM